MFDELGGFTDYNIGSLIWHDEHGHWHFKQYARYVLTDESAPGSSGVESEKTSFCLLDTDRVKPPLKGASKFPVFRQCGSDEQGISSGWADSYPYYLPGQAIDITGLSDGRYLLTIEIDPGHKILEADAGSSSTEDPQQHQRGDDSRITGDNVRVVDDDGGNGQGGGRGRGGGRPNR